MSYVSVDHGGYSDNMTIGSFSMAFSAPLTATGCSSCCHCNPKLYQNQSQFKIEKEIFFLVFKGHHQFEKINFAHQFLAKLIPTINNAENPTQSMNLIGEIFFITDQYIVPQS